MATLSKDMQAIYDALGRFFIPAKENRLGRKSFNRKFFDQVCENIRQNPIAGEDFQLHENTIATFKRDLKDIQHKKEAEENLENLCDRSYE